MDNRKMIYLDDAIDALAYFNEKSPTGLTAQEVVKGLPSAQPRKGKWVRANTHTDGVYECSACLQWTYIPFHPSNYNYCPRCGSDMRGDDDEI